MVVQTRDGKNHQKGDHSYGSPSHGKRSLGHNSHGKRHSSRPRVGSGSLLFFSLLNFDNLISKFQGLGEKRQIRPTSANRHQDYGMQMDGPMGMGMADRYGPMGMGMAHGNGKKMEEPA